MSPKFTITETIPTPLLKDFATFVAYLKTQEVHLTANEFIGGRDLYELNQQMTSPIKDATPRMRQALCPLLHLFYHLVLAGKLFRKASGKSGKRVLVPTDRLVLYEDLKPAEKYFFLLETFWVDADFNKLLAEGYSRFNPYALPMIMERLSQADTLDEQSLQYLVREISHLDYIALHFAAFGFWEMALVPPEKGMTKRWIRFRSAALLDFGIALAAILASERHFDYWNLPNRQQVFGEWNPIPGAPIEGEEHRMEKIRLLSQALLESPIKPVRKAYQGVPGEPFYVPFVPLFGADALGQTLPREGNQFVDGTYVFKVALRNTLWRRIAMSAKHTLLDLHYAIQQAYEFDNDHLYSFFMDGKAWSNDRISSPHDEEGPYVDEVQVGDLGLSEGQRILYLFDYGDNWQFQVTLEEIQKEGRKPSKPKVIEKKGKAPSQYGF